MLGSSFVKVMISYALCCCCCCCRACPALPGGSPCGSSHCKVDIIFVVSILLVGIIFWALVLYIMAHGLYNLIEWGYPPVSWCSCLSVSWVLGCGDDGGVCGFGILRAFSAFRGTDVPRNAATAQEIPGPLEGMVLIWFLIPGLSACCYLHLVRVVCLVLYMLVFYLWVHSLATVLEVSLCRMQFHVVHGSLVTLSSILPLSPILCG